MLARWCVTISSVLALLAPPATASELLSIRGIVLPKNGYVEAFTVATWGVKVLAVCHFPPGWTISAGKSADPSGILSGEASLGVTWLDEKSLHELDQIFLIEVEDYHEKAQRLPNSGAVIPASFSGTITVGTYGAHDPDWREVPITTANLFRKPASRCP